MKRIFSIVFVLVLVAVGLAQEKKTPVYYFNPHWSSDGKTIVFESTRDGKSAIYMIRTDGSNLQRLTDPASSAGQPRFSRDGKKIVFYSERDGRLQLYVMNADGTNQHRLSETDDLDYLPDFSPRGDYVVFQSRAERPAIAHDIFIIRTDGTNRARLTDGKFGYMSPKFSPDGKRIVFVRSVVPKKYYREMSRDEIKQMKASEEIFIMDKDGKNRKNLTNNEANDSSPQWSKNGKTIYFMSDRDGSDAVYAMRADGSNFRKIADGKIVTNPFISPDEKYFAYTKESGGKWAVYIYEIKTGKERVLIGN